jgi:hypothetical protein
MSKHFVHVIAPLLAVAFVLSGVVALGQQARDYLRGQARYRVAFHDIDCPAPDGLTHGEFLGEVQYVASWPDDVALLEDHLAARLEKAFAAHPWVEEVRRVEVMPDRHVRVELAFRTPILAVPTRAQGGAVVYRAADAYGVLLPRSTADASFQPRLAGDLPRPPGRAGTVWDDARVQTAVRTAVYLRPYREKLGIDRFEFAGDDLVVLSRQGRVVWGRAPGDERANEASAAVKLQRLLEPQPAAPADRDVRPLPETDTRLVKSK